MKRKRDDSEGEARLAKSFYNKEEILLEATGLQIEYNRLFQRRLDNFDVLNIINRIRKDNGSVEDMVCWVRKLKSSIETQTPLT